MDVEQYQGSTFTIYKLELGPMENFVHVIHDHQSGRGAVVDPAWDVAAVIALAQEKQFQITDVLLTHTHNDHTNGLQAILNQWPAQVHLTQEEAELWSSHVMDLVMHQDNDEIMLGETAITLLSTPGHTTGSACYYLNGHVITGDTLFIYSCGRCDLHGGNPTQMYHSLKRLAQLPPETVVHAGHNYSITTTATIAEQVAGNPFMHFDDIAAFTDYRMYQHNRVRSAPYSPVPKN